MLMKLTPADTVCTRDLARTVFIKDFNKLDVI